jgi:DNA repair protein RecO (recombination protein O)
MSRLGRELTLTGIVVHVRNFGEAHRIVEVLTADEGRLAAVARHARTSRRRFAGALDLFSQIQVRVSTGQGLWTLHEAALKNPRLGIRADLDRFARASRLVEAARLLVPEHAQATQAYQALEAGLDTLDTGDLAGAAAFYPRLLAAQGILPDLASCVRCARRGVTPVRLDVSMGGALCDACAPSFRALPAEVIDGLRGAACADVDIAQVVEDCAIAWIEGHTGRALRSRLPL